MSYRLESLQKILYQAVRCYQTLHTGEKVYFKFKRGQVKNFRANGGLGDQAHVFIIPEKPGGDSGWYPVNALHFEMPDGEVVK